MDSLILIWQKQSHRAALIHRDGACSSLAGSDVPQPTVKFTGPGSAGWLTVLDMWLMFPEARPCELCYPNARQ
jgi:hypothetical protein